MASCRVCVPYTLHSLHWNSDYLARCVHTLAWSWVMLELSWYKLSLVLFSTCLLPFGDSKSKNIHGYWSWIIIMTEKNLPVGQPECCLIMTGMVDRVESRGAGWNSACWGQHPLYWHVLINVLQPLPFVLLTAFLLLYSQKPERNFLRVIRLWFQGCIWFIRASSLAF